jgi:plasmid stabilization system protein ParE
MRVRLTSAAEAELADALNWYATHAPREAQRFLDELEALTGRLAQNPNRFPRVFDEVRRAGFHRFPYGLFFVVRGEDVQVFACFHASRNPRRWQDRV